MVQSFSNFIRTDKKETMPNTETCLFFENEINSKNQENKANQVIKPEIFIFKEDQRENCKYEQCNYFLNYF